MRASAVQHFLAPALGLSEGPDLEVFEEKDGHVIEGVLRLGDQKWFPIIDGVPCFLTGPLQPDFSQFAKKHNLPAAGLGPTREAAAEQAKTNETFSDKWRRFKNYGLEPEHQEFLYGWYLKKFGLSELSELKAFYAGKSRVLECGPGSGFNTKFISENCPGEVFRVGRVRRSIYYLWQHTASGQLHRRPGGFDAGAIS